MLQNTDNQHIKDLPFKIVVLNVVGSSPTGHPTEGSLYTRASLLIYKELRGRPPPADTERKGRKCFKSSRKKLQVTAKCFPNVFQMFSSGKRCLT